MTRHQPSLPGHYYLLILRRFITAPPCLPTFKENFSPALWSHQGSQSRRWNTEQAVWETMESVEDEDEVATRTVLSPRLVCCTHRKVKTTAISPLRENSEEQSKKSFSQPSPGNPSAPTCPPQGSAQSMRRPVGKPWSRRRMSKKSVLSVSRKIARRLSWPGLDAILMDDSTTQSGTGGSEKPTVY